MKRILSAILMLGLMLSLFAACSGGNGDSKETLVMATNAAFPPFEFVNEESEFDGFDVHLARAIADILGRELVVSDMEFTAALAAVTTGQADVAVAAITIREDRLETMDFSTPYFQTTIVAIVPDASDITAVGQLEDKRIAVQFGTTSYLFCADYLPDAEVIALNRAPDTVLELNNGNVDAIVVDRAVADQFISDNPGLRILSEPLGSENYGIAMQKGSDLLEPINDALKQLKDNGEYDRIYNMFFAGAE
ncbi:MAG: basic amino acid ABC transporter substrate-binding protein [Oscillospiraceae bacterium]|nr:basic amino acid ABC transporter substrate-binding protein [Oscillospiraceae bacterium]